MSLHSFKGRAVIPGTVRAPALVSRRGYNTLASFFPTLIRTVNKAHCGDRHNEDTFGREITGKVLCLPTTVGSTSGGSTWEYVARTHTGPVAVLCSGKIDEIAAAGLAVAAVWTDNPIVVVDQLGDDFLEHVDTGDAIRVHQNGRIEIEKQS